MQQINTYKLRHQALADFDFHKVLKVMRCLDWKWFSAKTSRLEIPTLSELVLAADNLMQAAERDLLMQVASGRIEGDWHSSQVSSGGFVAECHVDLKEGKLQKLWFNLYFSVESYYGYDLTEG